MRAVLEIRWSVGEAPSMAESPIDVLGSLRAAGASRRGLPEVLKGTVLDPDYVPPQRSADDADGSAWQHAPGGWKAYQKFVRASSPAAGSFAGASGRSVSPSGPARFSDDACGGEPSDGVVSGSPTSAAGPAGSTGSARWGESGPPADPGPAWSGAAGCGDRVGAGESVGSPGGSSGSGGPVGSGVLVAELRELASRLAVADLPDTAGVCLAEVEELLYARDRLVSAVAARVGRVHAAGEARSVGYASTGTWLRGAAGMTGAGASRLLRLATELARLPVVRGRFAAGTLAEGSVDAITQVTSGLTDEQVGLVEQILVDLADHATPAEIAKAGRYLRELLDPGSLDDEADADYAARFLLVRPSSTGGVEGEFRLPREAAARLREFLAAYARPKGKDDDRPLRVRQADALAALLSKKVSTELLVLVRAESLPDDPTPTPTNPARTNRTPDNPAGCDHSTPAADPTAHRAADPNGGDRADSGAARMSARSAGAGEEPVTGACHSAGATATADADSTGADAGRGTAETSVDTSAEAGAENDADPSAAAGVGNDVGAGAGADAAGAGEGTGAGAGADAGGGAGVGDAACGRCGHHPDRLAPGLLIATGQLLPISDVHRLARTSRLIRMVVDAKGQVLNMGRAVRLATPAQRQALIARYATCYCDGCAIPADMAEIDHVNGWINGSATDLEDMAPACTWHNRDKAAHPDRYTTHRNPDGTWTLTHLGRKGRYAARFRT
ncbi:HNH endonuclease [Planotetraspora sp. A-T 1434]|uniref:HNH endonuclease signature motif containing protein n=1 Tax=Planotetraspora sp. A-T 1434 TaxID=2979219 RepID=UPI0021BE4FFD|nr:HNH endonuclease signature motif containing protein [Planotetraspora sp. A-T 1434]MCT9932712.1 HNH endonuclease [Planotetraspora sp. A-T 1434]